MFVRCHALVAVTSAVVAMSKSSTTTTSLSETPVAATVVTTVPTQAPAANTSQGQPTTLVEATGKGHNGASTTRDSNTEVQLDDKGKDVHGTDTASETEGDDDGNSKQSSAKGKVKGRGKGKGKGRGKGKAKGKDMHPVHAIQTANKGFRMAKRARRDARRWKRFTKYFDKVLGCFGK